MCLGIEWSVKTLTLALLTLLHKTASQIPSQVHFCDEDSDEATISVPVGYWQQIQTVYKGQPFYGNNMKCTWLLDAGSDERRLQVNVKTHDLEWTPEGAICYGYDYMEIIDGEDEDEEVLVTWCGKYNPQSVISTGRYLLVKFRTNDRNAYENRYTGDKLLFTSFAHAETHSSVGTCPVGWVSDLRSRNCYAIKTHHEVWSASQTYCSYNKANLVSFKDEEEQAFVTEFVRNQSLTGDGVWIGLNDIRNEGVYRWIDSTNNSVTARWKTKPHTPNKYWDCVALSWTDWPQLRWVESYCTSADVQTLIKYSFVCKRNRVGKTTVHAVPQEQLTDKGRPSGVPVLAITFGVVAGLLLAVVCVILFVARRRHVQNRNQRAPERTSTETAGLNARPQQPRSDRPSTGPPSRVTNTQQHQPPPPDLHQRPPPTAPTFSDMEAPPSYEEAVQSARVTGV